MTDGILKIHDNFIKLGIKLVKKITLRSES